MIEPRKHLKHLKNYQVEVGTYIIKLDANETENYLLNQSKAIEFNTLNLYPDNASTILKQTLLNYLGQENLHVTFGNGSSELIELLIKSYIEPQGTILTFEPTFSMYKVYSDLYQANYEALETKDFILDTALMIKAIQKKHPKIVILCSPNNPTGYLIPKDEIIRLVESTDALVILDEAYIEFVGEKQSMLDLIQIYPNLVILRTLSKAFGLAGIRLGYMIGGKEIVDLIESVRAPYHINSLTQSIGAYALGQKQKVLTFTKGIIQRRYLLKEKLEKLGFKCYPTDANFIFVKSKIAQLGEKLKHKGVWIRDFKMMKDYYRITVGNAKQNDILLKTIEEIIHEN